MANFRNRIKNGWKFRKCRTELQLPPKYFEERGISTDEKKMRLERKKVCFRMYGLVPCDLRQGLITSSIFEFFLLKIVFRKKVAQNFREKNGRTLNLEVSIRPVMIARTFGQVKKATQEFLQTVSSPRTSEQINIFQGSSKLTKQAYKPSAKPFEAILTNFKTLGRYSVISPPKFNVCFRCSSLSFDLVLHHATFEFRNSTLLFTMRR